MLIKFMGVCKMLKNKLALCLVGTILAANLMMPKNVFAQVSQESQEPHNIDKQSELMTYEVVDEEIFEFLTPEILEEINSNMESEGLGYSTYTASNGVKCVSVTTDFTPRSMGITPYVDTNTSIKNMSHKKSYYTPNGNVGADFTAYFTCLVDRYNTEAVIQSFNTTNVSIVVGNGDYSDEAAWIEKAHGTTSSPAIAYYQAKISGAGWGPAGIPGSTKLTWKIKVYNANKVESTLY